MNRFGLCCAPSSAEQSLTYVSDMRACIEHYQPTHNTTITRAERYATVCSSSIHHYSAASKDTTLWLSGFVANDRYLSRKLKAQGHQLESSNPASILLPLYQQYGLNAWRQVSGNFFFCLIDEKEQLLHFGSDHFGTVPLFWALQGNTLAVAADLKTIVASAVVEGTPDFQAIWDCFTFGFIPGERTAVESVKKCLPGTCYSFSLTERRVQQTRYFQPADTPPLLSPQDAESELRYKLLTPLEDCDLSKTTSATLIDSSVESVCLLDAIAGKQRYESKSVPVLSASTAEAQHRAELCADHYSSQLLTPPNTTTLDLPTLTSVIATIEAPDLLGVGLSYHSLLSTLRTERVSRLHSAAGGSLLLGTAPELRFTQARGRVLFTASILQSFTIKKEVQRSFGGPLLRSAASNMLRSTFDELEGVHGVCLGQQVMWSICDRAKLRLFRERYPASLGPDSTWAQTINPTLNASTKAEQQHRATLIAMAGPLQSTLLTPGHSLASAFDIELRHHFLEAGLGPFCFKIGTKAKQRSLKAGGLLAGAFSKTLPHRLVALFADQHLDRSYHTSVELWTNTWVEEVLSKNSLERVGIFEPQTVASLLERCRATPERNLPAAILLQGVITGQLLCQQIQKWRQFSGLTNKTGQGASQKIRSTLSC